MWSKSFRMIDHMSFRMKCLLRCTAERNLNDTALNISFLSHSTEIFRLCSRWQFSLKFFVLRSFIRNRRDGNWILKIHFVTLPYYNNFIIILQVLDVFIFQVSYLFLCRWFHLHFLQFVIYAQLWSQFCLQIDCS